jgi:hypothetical protein
MRWVCHDPMSVVGIVMMKYTTLKNLNLWLVMFLNMQKIVLITWMYKIAYNPEMTGMWGIINPPGSRNNVHTHPYNYLSGVFYLKAPKKCGNIVFLEPKPQSEVLSPPKKEKASIHLAHSVQWEPVENSLIFFPSWLQHEVQTNYSNDDRVIISFNINWRKDDADS